MGLIKKNHFDLMNRPKENLLQNGVGITSVINTSDSEEDEISFERYSALPQDLTDNNSEQESDSQESSENEFESQYGPPTFDLPVQCEVAELWNSTNNKRTDIVMDSSKVEQIISAMADFKLPSTHIPQWAKQIPEEEWKQELLNKFYSLNK